MLQTYGLNGTKTPNHKWNSIFWLDAPVITDYAVMLTREKIVHPKS